MKKTLINGRSFSIALLALFAAAAVFGAIFTAPAVKKVSAEGEEFQFQLSFTYTESDGAFSDYENVSMNYRYKTDAYNGLYVTTDKTDFDSVIDAAGEVTSLPLSGKNYTHVGGEYALTDGYFTVRIPVGSDNYYTVLYAAAYNYDGETYTFSAAKSCSVASALGYYIKSELIEGETLSVAKACISNECAGLGGAGTEADPYMINTDADYEKFAATVNQAEYPYSGEYIRLGADIGEDVAISTIVGSRTGSYSIPFRGTFDGNGKSITVDINSNVSYVATFGYVNGATIKNLTVKGSVVSTNNSDTTSVGGIVGTAASTDRSTTISNCTNEATVTGVKTVGGVIGRTNWGLYLTGNTNNGNVSATGGNYAGGIVGYLYANAYINGCANNGDVTISDTGKGAGGIVGLCTSASNNVVCMTFVGEESTNSGTITASDQYGQLVGRIAANKYANADADLYSAVRDGTGSLGGRLFYCIYDLDDMTALASMTADFDTNASHFGAKLMNDIGDAEHPVTAMTGNATNMFKAVFDGAGHEVYLSLSPTAENAGLFGKVSGATIMNVTVRGTISSTHGRVAGIAGWITATTTVDNCVNYATVTSATSGTNGDVGGIVGLVGATSTVSNSKNYASVSITGAKTRVGGIVGTMKGKEITGCVNGTALSEATISSGTANYAGGIVGAIDEVTAKINNCKNYMDVSGASGVGGILGLNNYAGTFAAADGFKNNENYGKISGTTNAGKLIGRIAAKAVNLTIVDCYEQGALCGSVSDAVASNASTGTVTVSNSVGASPTILMSRVIDTGISGADPFVLKYDGKYYIYVTGASKGFKVYETTDFSYFKDDGLCFSGDSAGSKWAKINGYYWAPEVIYYGGEFIMYYSAKGSDYAATGGGLRIGVATSASPIGPFEDVLNEPMFDLGYSVIDPSPFIDGDGNGYLYYSRDCSDNIVAGKGESHIYGVRLTADKKSVTGEHVLLSTPDVAWETEEAANFWNEGPSVIKNDGKYYLSYSANHYRVKEYAVGYAVSDSPLGTYEKATENPILKYVEYESETLLSGPGHNCYFKVGDKWFTCFHAHKDPSDPSKGRKIFVCPAHFDGDDKLVIDHE